MPSSIQLSDAAQQMILSLHKLAATIETGILDPYPMLLVEATANLNRVKASGSSKYREIIILAEIILSDYQTALEILNDTPQSGARFSGGGFGLGGFVVGAAISTGINTLLDSADDKKVNASVREASKYWRHAATHIEKLEYLIQYGALPQKKSPAIADRNNNRSPSNISHNTPLTDMELAPTPPRKTKWGCMVTIIIILFIPFLMFKLATDNPSTSTVQPDSTTQQNRSTVAQPNVHNPANLPAYTPPEEPDWDVRKRSLEIEYERTAPKPDLSKEVTVTLKTGSTYRGLVVEYYTHAIVLKNGSMNITLERQFLDNRSHTFLWPGPMKATFVADHLKAEKERYFEKVQQSQKNHRDYLVRSFDDKLTQLKSELASCQAVISGTGKNVSGRINQVVGTTGKDVIFMETGADEPIYIDGLGSNHVDGDGWRGSIYYVGTVTFSTVLGANKKVRRYSLIPPKELPELIRKSKSLAQAIEDLQRQKATKLSACDATN